jgi:hypothetical protein
MECDPDELRTDITTQCRDPDYPNNSVAYDQLCFCDSCPEDTITYTSTVPGLLNDRTLLLDCNVALQQTEFTITALDAKGCPQPLQVRITGY